MERPNKKSLSAFVTGLCGLIKKKDLHKYLSTKCEGIKAVYLPNKRKAGYAFVETKTKKALKNFLALKGLSFNNRELTIKEFLRGGKLQEFKNEVNSRRLFVHSIPQKWKDEDLRQLFASYGAIEDAFVIRDRYTKKSKCFGYAIFEEKEDAVNVARRGCVRFKGSVVKVKMHEKKAKGEKKGSKKKSKNHLKQRKPKKPTKPKKITQKESEESLEAHRGRAENKIRPDCSGPCQQSRKKTNTSKNFKSEVPLKQTNLGHKPSKKETTSIKNVHQWVRPSSSIYYKLRSEIEDLKVDSRSVHYFQRKNTRASIGQKKEFPCYFSEVEEAGFYSCKNFKMDY